MPIVRPLTMKDHKWFWAAYKNGEAGFGTDILEPGLEQTVFRAQIEEVIGMMDDALMMEGNGGKRGRIPMGLVSIKIVQGFLMPHFDWFWWASARNKLECGLKFFFKYGDDQPLVMAVPAKSAVDRYLNHLVKYNVVRHVGVSDNWAVGKTAIFESRPCLG